MKTGERHAYHHGDLKNALLEAALRLLREEGHQALSLRKIALRVGVSQTAPYRHFADLEALYAAVAAHGFSRLARELTAIRAKYARYPLLQFRESGVRYVEFAEKNPDLFQVMYGNQIADHSRFPNLAAAENEPFRVLLDILRECNAAGVLHTPDIHKAAMSAWTMAHGIAILLSGKQIFFQKAGLKKAKALTKDLIQLLYAGLK